MATLILATFPQADRIVVIGIGGERVIEPTSNVLSILLSDLDKKIEIKKVGYKNAVFNVPNDLLHGTKIQKDKEMEL